jgi:hypothetical protein
MAENRKAAEQLAIDDIHSLGTHQAMFYEHGVLENAPPGDGEGAVIPVCIGMRGNLTKGEARQAAWMWQEIVARYPKAAVYLHAREIYGLHKGCKDCGDLNAA